MSAYEWCIAQGILRVHQVGNTRMLQLTPDYQQPPGQTRTRQSINEGEQTARVHAHLLGARWIGLGLQPAANSSTGTHDAL